VALWAFAAAQELALAVAMLMAQEQERQRAAERAFPDSHRLSEPALTQPAGKPQNQVFRAVAAAPCPLAELLSVPEAH
jgi:hypothetical protein